MCSSLPNYAIVCGPPKNENLVSLVYPEAISNCWHSTYFLFSLIHLENLVDQIGTDHPFDTITELIEEVLGNDLNFLRINKGRQFLHRSTSFRSTVRALTQRWYFWPYTFKPVRYSPLSIIFFAGTAIFKVKNHFKVQTNYEQHTAMQL